MQEDQFIKCENNLIGTSPLEGKDKAKLNSIQYKTTYKKTLKDKIMNFYYYEFDKITRKYKRGKVVSFVIFSAYQLQQISLLYNNKVQELISSNSNQNIPSQLYQLISYIRIEPLISDLIDLNNAGSEIKIANLSKYITVFFFLFFSLLFIVHILVRLIVYVIEAEDDTAEVHVKALHKSQEEKSIFGGGKSTISVHMLQENFNLVFDTIASFYYQFILFLFFIPSAQIFSEIYNDQLQGFGYTLASICTLNIVLHLIIVVIYVIHDYDYEISYSDHLSKRDSLWGFFHIIAKGAMATFYNTSWGIGISTIHWTLKCFEIAELFIEFPYYDELIRRWNCLCIFCHFSFSFIAYLFMFFDLKHNCNISMIYLIVIPLALQIGNFVYYKMEKRVKEVYKHSQNPSHVDMYVRYLNQLYDLEYNKYTQLKYGVDFESVYTDHIIKCSDFKCFCSEYQYKPFKWENFIQSDDRSYFLQNYIVKLLESQTILQQNKKDHAANRLLFTYLQFLIEKVPNPTKAFTQIIINLKNKNILSIKEQYELHIIMKRCQSSYRQFFIDSTFQNQRLPMMTVISFDYLLESSINLFKDILYEIRQFYNFLCQDLINIDILCINGQRIVKKRHLLEQNVRLLFDINPRSDILYGLAEGYTKLLDLKSRRVKTFKKRSLDLLHRNILKQDTEINLTNKNSCIIYISLLSQGQIKKLTHSFQQIFGVPMKGVIGKSVDSIMPDIFSENHDKYIQKFLEKGSMDNMNKARTNLFGKNALGFIFPIHLRIRLNYIGYEDYGVCGHISKVQDNYSDFIVLDKDLNISEVSRKFYKTTFQNIFDQEINKIKKINITRLIPLIGVFIEENYFNKESLIESTLMVIPQSTRQLQFFRKRNANKKEALQKYAKELSPSRFLYFEVTVQLIIIKSSYGNVYRAIEIKKMRKIKRTASKSILINEFLEQYNKTFTANLNYIEHNNNSSSRYLDTATVIDNSQINNSSISGSSYRQLSTKKKNQAQGERDIFALNKTKTEGGGVINSLNKLITGQLRFETLIGVQRLVKKFVKNMYSAINKRRSSKNIIEFAHQNNFFTTQITKLEKFNSVDTNDQQRISFSEILSVETPQASQSQSKSPVLQKRILTKRDSQTAILMSPQSSIQLQRVNSEKVTVPTRKEGANGKSSHKKSSFLMKNFQNSENDYGSQYEGGEKEEGYSNYNYFGDILSGRGGTQMANEQSQYPYFGSINSPTPSDIPLFPYQNLSNIPLGNGSGPVGYELSARYDYHNNQQQQYNLMNSLDNYHDNPHDFHKNEGKFSLYSTQIQNQEDQEGFSSSTKNPSSITQLQINSKKQINDRPVLTVQSPKDYFRDIGSTIMQDEVTQILTPHLKSENQLIQIKQEQQKFYDKVGSSDFQKLQTVSLIETVSPIRQSKYNLKKYTTNYLHQVKETQHENGFNTKNRSTLIDEFEQEEEEDDEKSGTRKTRNKKNTETIFEAADAKKKRRTINDQQSVNSALSQTYSKKLQVVENLTSTQKPLLILSICKENYKYFYFEQILLIQLELAGIAAFLFMVTVTSGIFIYLNSIFQSNIDDFNNLIVGPSLQSDYAYLLKEKETINLQNNGQLASLNQSIDQILTIQKKLIFDFKRNTLSLFNERSWVEYSVRVNNQYLEVDYFLIVDRQKPSDYLNSRYPMKFLINYSTLILFTYMQYLVDLNNPRPNSVRFIEKNLITYFDEFQNIQSITHDESFSEVTNMENNVILTIAIMEGIAFLVLIIAIPIYSKIQSSRENWLQLFATWPQNKLSEMINEIDLYITEEYGTLKQLERQTNSKRKTVSSVTDIKRFNKILYVQIFICLILVSIYPIVNLIFTQDFVREFNYSIKEITIIFETRAQINTEFALTLQVSRKKYLNQPIDQNFINYYLKVHEINKQKIQDLYYLSEHFTGRRYQKEKYLNLIIKALNEDICEPIQNNPQYYAANQTFNIIKCKTVYNQILTKGIIGTLKEIQTQFKNLQEIILGPPEMFKQGFEDWVIDSDLNQLLEVQRLLSDYLEILQTFLMNMTIEYKNYIKTIQFWLYLYSLFVLVAIFLLGFNFFVRRLTKSLYQTRYLMTLFKVDNIIENSYIMSFLSDQISKGKIR